MREIWKKKIQGMENPCVRNLERKNFEGWKFKESLPKLKDLLGIFFASRIPGHSTCLTSTMPCDA